MFLLWQAWKKLRKIIFRMLFLKFSFNMFGPQLQDLKVWCHLKPSVVALKKTPWSVEALNDLGISGALHLGERTSTDGAALGIALQTWGCIFNFPTSPCIWDLKYPLHLISCDNVGMTTVQNTLAFTGPPTCCRVNCCLHVANWGQWRAAHILCELLSHFRIIRNWFRVWLDYGRCRYGLRSLCWAMRWLHTMQAYNIEGCWWQLVLFLYEEKSKIGHTFWV